MAMDPHTRGQRYLGHLTRTDRELLADAADADGPQALGRHPDQVEELLGLPAVFDAVFATGDAGGDEELIGVSPFLCFAVAVHRARAELDDLSYVEEWTGPRQRVPVFATDQLREFLDAPGHRLFLAELLASYTHVAGGAVTVRRRGTTHRRRFSELDLAALAGLLDVATDDSRPGLYRRLGDLALFLTGVFPDHTARTGFAPIEVDRIARAVRPELDMGRRDLQEQLAADGPVGLLERLGQAWYRLALEAAPVRTRRLATLESVGEQFVDARRVLNHVTDRHLLPMRGRWFPSAN